MSQKLTFIDPTNTISPNGILIEFDASLSEKHKQDSEIVSHPVEGGADITDHIRRLPQEIEFSVLVSNHPVIFEADDNAVGILGGDPKERDVDAYNLLRRLQTLRARINVTSTLSTYNNYAISSVSPTRDKDTGNTLTATVSLKEIIEASTDFVALPVRVKRRQKKKKKKGKKNTKPAPPEKDQSLLTRTINFATGS